MSGTGDRTLDTRGLLCPEPIIELASEIAQMGPGGVLTVISDDSAFPLDARAWCAGTGNELLSLEERGREFLARIRKRTD